MFPVLLEELFEFPDELPPEPVLEPAELPLLTTNFCPG
ncbi:hypothetical protein RV11_GL002621 [Enterococcus phoeniculicola]|nr:hypothetical protein RV11_GL002621 [Enterococcus phoeniculicola]